MRKPLAILLALSFFASGAVRSASSVHAETPCDFKGVSVGDKMTPAEVMSKFGVANYKMNPTLPSWKESEPLITKYGIAASGELEDWNVGPFCDDTSCRIPYGVSVGNNNTPVNVFVSLRNGQLTEIDVAFSEMYWDEILPLLDKKYGPYWESERDPNMVITNLETKKSTMLERITLTHKGGINPHTHDTCEIWATNLDIVFQHHDPLGPYHSIFVIKLVSKNF